MVVLFNISLGFGKCVLNDISIHIAEGLIRIHKIVKVVFHFSHIFLVSEGI